MKILFSLNKKMQAHGHGAQKPTGAATCCQTGHCRTQRKQLAGALVLVLVLAVIGKSFKAPKARRFDAWLFRVSWGAHLTLKVRPGERQASMNDMFFLV